MLQQAVDLAEESVSLSDGYYRPWFVYFHCALVHWSRFESCGEVDDIDRAIECAQKATQDQNYEKRWDCYRLLAQVLLLRYDRLHRIQDLSDSLSAASEGQSKCRPGDTNAQANILWMVGKASYGMYHNMPSIELLHKIRGAFLQASQQMEDNQASKALVLNDLGNVYTQLFRHEAKPDQLQKAIDAYKEALSILEALSGDENHSHIFMVSGALGSVMSERFSHWQSDADIESSIRYYRISLSQIDNRNPRFRIRAANMCYALTLRFRHKKNLDDLREARRLVISALEGPVSLNNEQRADLTMHVADTYQVAYEVTGDLSDLKDAIKYYDKAKAIQGSFGSSSQRGLREINKGVALSIFASATRDLTVYEAREKAYLEALSILEESDPFHSTAVHNYARLIYDRYSQKLGADASLREDARRALEKYESITRMNVFPAFSRISAGSIAAKIANDELKDPVRARDNILISLDLLPEAILMHETRLKQLQYIRRHQYVPGVVASLSLSAGDSPSTVIQRLETGRAFIWDRIQGRPTQLEVLEAEHPDLAAKFNTLQQRVFQKSRSSSQLNRMDLASVSLHDETRMQSHYDADAYRRVLEEIRTLPGFSSFLKIPDSPADIQACATDSPIIFINATKYRSDAIVITKDEVCHIPLPSFGQEEIMPAIRRFRTALYYFGSAENHTQALYEYEIVMKMLWETAAKPVLSGIDWSKYKCGPSGKPRVIWVSTGWISILPIHAAGDFTTSNSTSEGIRRQNEPRCVHDIAVSSYTNSLKSLSFIKQVTEIRKKSQPSQKPKQQALVIAMATTPGFGPDGNLDVQPETTAIENMLSPNFETNILMQPDSTAMKKNIHPETTILHFACHARADESDPSRSAIMLQDNQKMPPPFSVRTLLNLNLRSCELVYLSACESGVSKDPKLRDEGIHIAGGFHIAGVSHVISTWWKVSDSISAELAGLFYERLNGSASTSASGFDMATAPDALYDAVKEMRKRSVHPMFWGAFIHSGP
ncbi:hypothetical protein N7532_001230 [Penicillium argentinense]|uniref:CHAT domain-containing protein n=1 Tax=Penicillium argentinense TaxID=1131581 RepID=A0A9W9G242_9EURO|nr:uncharacterized protein N7532_001230 [Penicillium argentinense]KAJ5110695.1 hypothetical protein N7532_001230 [Penicillium argentinense]